MLVVMPAMAEPSHTGEFPSTGLMQEDYTYTNAATFENTGVYDGSVDAIAEFEYQIGAGEYLPAGADEIVDCPAGSYCPGISGNVQYNQSTPQGIQTCPTEYASSAAGSSSNTQCYRACDINNMGTSFTNIAHAKTVSGNDYYGSGTDTCEPTDCVNGWHIKSGLDLTSTIGTSEGGASLAFINNNGQFREDSASYGQSYYGISDNSTWAVNYRSSKGMLIGQARCSTQPGSNGEYTNGNRDNNGDWSNTTKLSSLTDETGQEGAQYCYCNVTGYKDDSGNMQAVSSPWVFREVVNYGGGCADYCANRCAYGMGDGYSTLTFRAVVFGSAIGGGLTCEANTITINWSDASQTDIDANNAGTATYGSDVRTPVKATTKKGKTFRGWRFSKPETTNLPE